MDSSVSDQLAQLRTLYIKELPIRLASMLEIWHRLIDKGWNRKDAESLHKLLHSLTGSAGTFGLNSVSVKSREVEKLFANHALSEETPTSELWSEIQHEMDNLLKIIQLSLQADFPSLKPVPHIERGSKHPLIFLVEDDLSYLATLSLILNEKGFRVRQFSSIASFCTVYEDPETEKPAALIMDMSFPESNLAGADAITAIRAGHTSFPPVIFVSARDDIHSRLAAFRAGATRYLAKPISYSRLIDLLDEVTGRQPELPYRVLMVDDDPILLEAQAAYLRESGMQVDTLSTPLSILDAFQRSNPDVVVLDVYMPDATGPELAAILREHDETQNLPILFLSAETDISQQLLALNLGGDDFLVKPVQPEHLIAAVTARARRARENIATRQRLETTIYEREREHLALNQHAIVSIADRGGNITYANDKFREISGYSLAELIGQNHRLLKSGQHPPEFYRNIWQTITNGKVWQGEICNRRKDGSLYWVASTITPFIGDDGKPYQYVSIRTDITHVKQNEADLNEIKERLRRGQMFANIGTWDWNIVTGELYWTERIATLFGYPVGELETSYDNFLAAIHPDDRQAVIDAVNNCIEHDAPYEIEHRVVWPDGTIRWLLERGAVLRDAEQKPIQMLGVVQDITDRKQAELALAESDKRFSFAVEGAGDGIWDWNILTGEMLLSGHYESMLGYAQGELESTIEAWVKSVHPADLPQVQSNLHDYLEGKSSTYNIELRLKCKDDHYKWILCRGTIVKRDPQGRAIRMIGIHSDISERKIAEQALADRERFLKTLIDIIPGMVGYWTSDLHCHFANREYEKWFGKSPEQLRGITMHELLGEELFRKNEPYIRAALRGETQHFERTLTKANGSTGYTWAHYIPDKVNGKVHGFFVVISDISEIKQAQVRLEELNQELATARDESDRANQAKSEFLSSMSHELRTPMNAILGFGQLLQYDASVNEEHQDSVREIIKAGEHLLDLINEVLDLAKIESGRIDLSLEPIELCPVVDECLSLIEILAEKRHIKISHTGMQGVALRADRTRLKQVLLNLLSNAVKYNREGGTVHLEVKLQGTDRIRILVTDSGIGIPANKLQNIFQPFNRLDAENSNIEGTGIGLTITRRILEMMGGSVDVTSDIGVGSTFWIELPIESAPAKGESGKPIRSTGIEAPPPDVSHLVLYIEDNPSNLRLMAQILGRRKNIHLVTAHTPELGIELAMAKQPDLILLDINMPGMSGYQVLDILKAKISLKPIPVIAVTANAMPRDLERGIAAGFYSYLTKPIDINMLQNTLDSILQK